MSESTRNNHMKADINSFTARFIFDSFIKLEINKRFYQMTLVSQCFTFNLDFA